MPEGSLSAFYIHTPNTTMVVEEWGGNEGGNEGRQAGRKARRKVCMKGVKKDEK